MDQNTKESSPLLSYSRLQLDLLPFLTISTYLIEKCDYLLPSLVTMDVSTPRVARPVRLVRVGSSNSDTLKIRLASSSKYQRGHLGRPLTGDPPSPRPLLLPLPFQALLLSPSNGCSKTSNCNCHAARPSRYRQSQTRHAKGHRVYPVQRYKAGLAHPRRPDWAQGCPDCMVLVTGGLD